MWYKRDSFGPTIGWQEKTKLLITDVGGTIRLADKSELVIPGVKEKLDEYSDYFIVSMTDKYGIYYGMDRKPKFTLRYMIDSLHQTILQLPQIQKIYFTVEPEGKYLAGVGKKGGNIIPIEKEYSNFRKPNPGIYEFIIDEFKQFDEVLMVGNSERDRGFAESINCKFIRSETWLPNV